MKFHYCSYWRMWSRRLCVFDRGLNIVDLNLTPINGWSQRTIDEVRFEVIRCHGTANSPRDIDTDVLPDGVRADMVKHLGEELTERLLTFNYMRDVSLDDIKFAQQRGNGGGMPYDIIKAIVSGELKYWCWPN